MFDCRPMHHGKLLTLLRQILDCPTAPFHEYHVAAKIRELLAPMPHVSIDEDKFGNLIATYRRGRKKPHLAFAAHMDHPGWVPKSGSQDPDDLEFLGGVPKDRLTKGKVARFGEFGMWDLPAFELRDGLIRSRACDDLIGCVEIVALFQELERLEVDATCYGLFTRAEEVGFVGAVHLAKSWPLDEQVRFVSLETSAPRGGAEMGSGPVVRAGDRMSIFDDAVTAELLQAATNESIPVQRCLLDGGACEATATQLYGIPSAGMSVLLGNYHNCAPDGGIDVEYVSLADVKAMIKLIVATTIKMAAGGNTKSAKASMRDRLEQRVRDHRIYDRAAKRAWKQFPGS
jgi:endoglucanase